MKKSGFVAIGVLGALLLGLGMCLAMVWDSMIMGICVGVGGIAALLSLLPFVKGFAHEREAAENA